MCLFNQEMILNCIHVYFFQLFQTKVQVSHHCAPKVQILVKELSQK